MAKQESESSPRGGQAGENVVITSKHVLTDKDRRDLARIAQKQAADDDSDIDYSDIPELTDEELAGFKRLHPRA